jgi:hypothetical protein
VPGQSAALPVARVTAFPPGHDEDDARLHLVADGLTGTVWSTQEYTTSRFGNLRPGVGIVLALDGPHTVRHLIIDSPSTGWTGQVYVAAQPASTLGGWGRNVTRFTVSRPTTTVSFTGSRGVDVLVWITDLGDPNPNAPSNLPFRVDIGEIRVLS